LAGITENKASGTSELPARRSVRVLQSIGAAIVTILVLFLLFGIPARLLFGTFFD